MLKPEEVKYLVFDIESVPDATLIRKVKYPNIDIDDVAAVRRFQEEILQTSGGTSYFIPVTFQLPVSICIAKVKDDFTLCDIVSLDEPKFRPAEMTRLFWEGVENVYSNAKLVTFNGRGFDVPLMELMAFRYGIRASRHFKDKFASRFRYGDKHFDIHDWLSNYNAIRVSGGLNLLAKVLGKPGKMETTGDDVYDMYLQGKLKEINEYCTHDVLDTYFAFLRTRILFGELTLEREKTILEKSREYIRSQVDRIPALSKYLENWGDWTPWP
jgi:hypothetical protein